MYLKAISFKVKTSENKLYNSLKADLYTKAKKLQVNEFLVLSRDNIFDVFTVESNFKEINNKLDKILGEYIINKLNEFKQREAVTYFFELMLGKYEKIVAGYNILTQIKENFNIAMDNNATGPILTKLYRSGIRFGELIRQQPEISKNGISTAEAIIDIAKKISENLSDFQILIFGHERERIESSLHSFKNISNKNILLHSNESNESYLTAMELGCLPIESDQFSQILTGNTLIINTEDNFTANLKDIIQIAKNNRKS